MTPVAPATGPAAAGLLAPRGAACDDARPMQALRADAAILTSARMAAGMTSRARRQIPLIAG